MLQHIPANDLKTKGVSALRAHLSDGASEAFITVRGHAEYVVMPIDTYNQYRELELTLALEESKRDLKAGKLHKGSVSAHMKRILK